MTAIALGWRQLVSLFFLLLVAPRKQLGVRATSDCTSGFISLDRLATLAAPVTSVVTLAGRQVVFPNINFTCNGVIVKVTVLVQRFTDIERTLYPELQVWRRNEFNGVYTRVGGATLSEELSENEYDIYVHTLDSPLEFQTGDVFGIFQPQESDSRLRVAFLENSGPESLFVDTGSAEVPPDTFSSTDTFTDYPLVVITADPQECVSGSASLETVQAVRDLLNVVHLDTLLNRQSVSPQISFTCDGNITKWIVGAIVNSVVNDLPELQVWRRVNGSTPNSYRRVGNTVIAVAEENSDSSVYEYPVDPPLPVEAGDVLGIYQPPRGDSRLKVWYERDAGPVTLYQTPRSEGDFPDPAGGAVQSHSSLPLVTVEIVPNSVSLSTVKATTFHTSPVMSSLLISETPGGGVDMPTSFPATALGTGVAVGVVVAIVTLGAVMMVMVLVHNHKMGKYSLKESTAGDAGGESAQSMKIYGNNAYQTAAEAIATEKNEAYSGRVEGIDHTHTTTVDYEEISSPDYAGGEMENSGACLTVKNEAYGTADSAQFIEIHGNDAYQTAAEAIATEQNEAYSGRVEGIDHTLTTTVDYEEISAPDCAKEPSPTTAINGQSTGNPSMVENEAYGIAESAEAIATEQNEAYSGRVEGIDHTQTTTADYACIL